MTARPDRLRHWLYGDDPRQQRRIHQSLLVLGVYATYSVIQVIEVLLGLLDPGISLSLALVYLLGGSFFYALLRSGWNLRLVKGRALTLPQALWAVSVAVMAYGFTGPARGAVLLVLMSAISFCVFALRPREVALIESVALVELLGTMAWKVWGSDQPYALRVELVHLLLALFAIAFMSLLALRVGGMRERLESQRRELERALERIRTLAAHDDLTGLPNRRTALERLDAILNRRQPASAGAAVALIDLDHFKQINDRHGHAVGDEVLRRFADAARATLRNEDIMARWGGEEFLLILPGGHTAAAEATLERLRERLQQLVLPGLGAGDRVRFSAGVATCRALAELDRSIERADTALYTAKAQGRDRTVVAEEALA